MGLMRPARKPYYQDGADRKIARLAVFRTMEEVLRPAVIVKNPLEAFKPRGSALMGWGR